MASCNESANSDTDLTTLYVEEEELARFSDKSVNNNKKKHSNKSKSKTAYDNPYQLFTAGAFPEHWMQDACKLGSSASRVAVCCRHLYGLNKKGSFSVSNISAKKYGLDRAAKTAGLKLLKEAGLISMIEKNGRAPIVTIIIRPIDYEK